MASRNSASSSSVYLNPRFKNIHINPKFIQASIDEPRPTKIHVNPNFIAKNEVTICEPKNVLSTPLVCTRTKLIRSVKPLEPLAIIPKPENVSGLKKIGLRKLVRKTSFSAISSGPQLVDRVSKFKVVRNTAGNALDPRPKVLSTRFRLKRASFSEVLTPRKVIASKYRLRRM